MVDSLNIFSSEELFEIRFSVDAGRCLIRFVDLLKCTEQYHLVCGKV